MAHPRVRNKAEALGLARQYVRMVRESGIPVQNALMFGSFAKKKSHEWSDVDVAIVSEDFGRDRLLERARLRELAIDVSSAIEPHPFHPDELLNRWSTLAQEIKKYGIEVKS